MSKNLHFIGIISLLGLVLFAAGFLVAWFLKPVLQGDRVFFTLALATLILIGAGMTFNNFIQAYILETRRITEEMRVIMSVNPAHRVDVKTPGDVRVLADTINSFADRFQEAIADKSHQIEKARANLEEEKNRLAALMSELTTGVIVCNQEGQILLYNTRATQMLKHASPNPTGGYIGLGRSIFGVIDRNTITHIVDKLIARRDKKSDNQVSQVVLTAANGQLIRTRTVIISGQYQDEISGFVLTLENVTRQTQRSLQRDTLLQTLTEGVRSSLASIRAAIETLEQSPDVNHEQSSRMRAVIHDQSVSLSVHLNQVAAQYDNDLKADWQLEEMIGTDLLWAIKRHFEDKLQVNTTIAEQDDNLWLKVDSFLIVQAMTHIMQRLADNYNINQVDLLLRQTGQLASLDLRWKDSLVDLDTLWAWQNEREASMTGDKTPITLREVAERHGGEVWCQADKESNTVYVRLLLTAVDPKYTPAVHIVQGSRPEYYDDDFDLFHQPGQTSEMDQFPLSELTYTVFDTETTGLNPAADEIISISAVRIVSNRLLRQEIFDQLIDPQRRLSAQTTEITGISDSILAGQPTISQILPSFHKFTQGTVLVAHNAAFDMQMLQQKQIQTGVAFPNPVLDTLLLSAVTHANNKDHSLEKIAQRLGVNIIGRHTSLGDAMVTGEIFLRLIPILAEQGITTLAEAREAAEQTYLARIKY
jgi:DNA polymerase-3 subunit epsilon